LHFALSENFLFSGCAAAKKLQRGVRHLLGKEYIEDSNNQTTKHRHHIAKYTGIQVFSRTGLSSCHVQN
jgi:hypothetical protein